MRRLMEIIFDTSHYAGPVDKERARLVYSINLLAFGLIFILMFTYHDVAGTTVWHQIPNYPILAVLLIVFIGSCLASFLVTRRGQRERGAVILTVALVIGLGGALTLGGVYAFNDGILITLLILMAGLLLGTRGLWSGSIAAVVAIVLSIIGRSYISPPVAWNSLYDLAGSIVNILMISGVLFLYLRFATINRLEAESSARISSLKLADITSQVARRISRRTALNQVLADAVEQVRDNYPDVYHAQIFLVDDKRQKALLAASTGEVGRLLMERKHSLPVGSISVIGQVTESGKPIIARTDATQTIHQRNEFLPDTAVEAAFPLQIGDVVIGALDLQSKIANAFTEEDIPILQSLSDHIAIAIDNARLFGETERRLKENEELVEQSRKSIAEVERLNQRLTGRFWEDFLSQQSDTHGLQIHFDDKTSTPETSWTPSLREAVRFNHLVQDQQGEAQVIAVPLRVRGQVIGAMEFELGPSGNLAPEDVNLIEEVGEQLGLAAETTRLFEMSQRMAHREALVNEITARLQLTNNVEATLSEAARSLKEALKAHRVAIRLGKPAANGTKEGQP